MDLLFQYPYPSLPSYPSLSYPLPYPLPYIFIFDVDNTIIGNVDYIGHEVVILDIITNKHSNNNYNITKELKTGLLRPYFKDFINFIIMKYKYVELYIYTNSPYDWTNNYTIPNIEKVIGKKFNKPYFTRENTNKRNKLLGNIFDIIINNLKSKYPYLNDIKNIEYVFNNQLVFIDDIKNNLKDYPQKQILCPEYNYKDYYKDG